jgi:hypothetical protein
MIGLADSVIPTVGEIFMTERPTPSEVLAEVIKYLTGRTDIVLIGAWAVQKD